VKYLALNPVRAGLVEAASSWPWSSVQAHLGIRVDRLVTLGPVGQLLDEEGESFFDEDLDAAELDVLRMSLGSGRHLSEPRRKLV
jgi:putative transposase